MNTDDINKEARKKRIDQEDLYQTARKAIHLMVTEEGIDAEEMEELLIHIYIKYGRYRSFLPEPLKKYF